MFLLYFIGIFILVVLALFVLLNFGIDASNPFDIKILNAEELAHTRHLTWRMVKRVFIGLIIYHVLFILLAMWLLV